MADENTPELTPFEKLIKDYPKFIVRNRTDVAQMIALKDGNDVQVQPNATVPIDSSDLHQIPDYTIFKLESPKMKVIREYGVYGDQTEDMVLGEVKEEPAPSRLSNPAPVTETPTSERVVPTSDTSSSKPSTAPVADVKKSKN